MVSAIVPILMITLAQDPAQAEKLFRNAEKKVADAETVHASAKGQIDLVGLNIKLEYKVTIWTAKGNKSRVEDVAYSGGQEFKYTRIADGKDWHDIPSDPTKKRTSKPAPVNLSSTLAGAATRSGVSLGYAWANDHASRNPKLLDDIKASNFALGEKEKVGDRETQVVNYKLAFDKQTFTCRVWIDSETGLPLKRSIASDQKDGNRWTETCEFRLGTKLEEKLFDAGK